MYSCGQSATVGTLVSSARVMMLALFRGLTRITALRWLHSWLFSATNVVRTFAARKYNLGEFQLSQVSTGRAAAFPHAEHTPIPTKLASPCERSPTGDKTDD